MAVLACYSAEYYIKNSYFHNTIKICTENRSLRYILQCQIEKQ